MNVGALLARAAARAPESPAIRYADRRLTYRELNERASRLASGLGQQGLRPGDRVGVLMRNRPELLESLFACFRGGFVAVPLNARLHPDEARYIIANAGCEAAVFADGFHESVPAGSVRVPVVVGDPYESVLRGGDPASPDIDVPVDHPAWLFYTSGTTGRPKGAVLSHQNLVRMVVDCVADVTPYHADDVVLHVAPLTHGCGLYALAGTARGSAHLIDAAPSFDPPTILRTIERERVTVLSFLTPTMIAMILNHPEQGTFDTGTLRSVVYGGGPMYLEDMRRALDRFGPVFAQVYGMGEAPMTITYLSAADHVRRPDASESAGVPHPDVELRIVDGEDRDLPQGMVGEVCVRGAVVMRGYWNDPAATAETLRGGWLHTGDTGRLAEDGYLYLLDRKKDLIISGGNNIYPREVEEALLRHPDVQEATVIGIPDRLWGESVHAVVVRRPGRSLGQEDLIRFCQSQIAGYKKPRSVEFVEGLPKSAYGKVLKRQLRDRYWQDRKRGI